MPHINEKIDFTASCFLVHEKRVLFVRHKKLGMWLQPGGHIEPGEGPLEALLREIEEEVGLVPDQYEIIPARGAKCRIEDGDIILPQWVNRHRISSDHEHIDFTYVARAFSQNVRTQETENEAARWFPAEELQVLDSKEEVKKKAIAALALVN